MNFDVSIPGSKSYTNRALIIASLAEGESRLYNMLESDDTKFMVKALKDLGVEITISDSEKGRHYLVKGNGGRFDSFNGELFIGNAGTTMRFLTGLVSLVNGEVVIKGNERMSERPIGDLVDGLIQLGVNVHSSDGFPPVNVNGSDFSGGKVKMKGDKSSQYASSIMMVAPYAKNPVDIIIEGEITSRSYIDITIDIMNGFGIEVVNENYKKFRIPSGKYKSQDYLIEGDTSNASYFLAGAAITKGIAIIRNINVDSVQGDIGFVDILEKMGAEVEKSDDYIKLVGRELKGIEVDMNQMPDTVQTLAVVALFAEGKTLIKNVANLKIKETDRLNALKTELEKLGAQVNLTEDSIEIIPTESYKSSDIETYDDHRMAMSFAVAKLRLELNIKNSECVSKSFPNFWEVFK